MPAHKFITGQKVRITPELVQQIKPDEIFTVIRQLPDAVGIPQYRVKSDTDGHERVVRETQLADL